MNRLRALWRSIFQPRALRLPGKFPWKKPDHLPFGTVLIDDPTFPIIADGLGGVVTGRGHGVLVRSLRDQPSRATSRRTR